MTNETPKVKRSSKVNLRKIHLDSRRGAGILLHISSLPSSFGIGDMGPEAERFAEFLNQSGQRYWQLLPLNPTGEDQAFSPYSAVSSMAGNTLLISPEKMASDGLISPHDLKKFQVNNSGKVNYKEAELVRDVLFERGFRTFLSDGTTHLPFREFCKREAYWLDDYATYVVIKDQHENKPWYEWPTAYKQRQPKTVGDVNRFHMERINKAKWLQYIFDKQWRELKIFCNNLNVLLFGDLPFYVSYDSADVWANPHIFKLDNARNMAGIAGVPPDYFNAKGQMWGMPVFRWDVLKKKGYSWWIDRIRKNFELFDLVRLDHFRAFVSFWEVPAGEKTAVNGKWQRGPGHDFFNTVFQKLGKLPFIAEDLGDVDAAVYALRDEFNFPGMKVLQFAFGDNMTTSDYIPHNYTPNFVAYTGTHDNNTTVGWWLKDTKQDTRANLKQYVDEQGISQNTIHLVLSKMAYSSVANTVILPLQDVLGLDETARMNLPASAKGNWLWRLKPGQLLPIFKNQLMKLARLYNRV
ncbi:MAG: 4-alpha-glucanotransferase [Cyclobacteriaceae bacterium]